MVAGTIDAQGWWVRGLRSQLGGRGIREFIKLLYSGINNALVVVLGENWNPHRHVNRNAVQCQ